MPISRYSSLLALFILTAVTVGCQPATVVRAASVVEPSDTPVAVPDSIWRPAPGTSWQWQLVDDVDTRFDVDMYNIDLFNVSKRQIAALQADGRVVVCYFSAGTREAWRSDARRIAKSAVGRKSNWPRERWLDIRALDLIGPVLEARLAMAAEKGCDGVEPDNVDGYINDTGFELTADDQLRFNRWIAERAHEYGLSVGLKNDVDQIVELEPWFDWALNERCYELGECARMRPFIDAGKAVFGVEYRGNPDRFCPELNARDYDWLKKQRRLGPERKACR